MAITRESAKLASFAGVCAAGGSVCGKLSGIEFFPPAFVVLNFFIQLSFFGLMLSFNAFVWKFYATALQSSSSSLPPTLISTASNYICSALSGCLLFGEKTSLLWWSGSALILFGLALVTISTESPEKLLSEIKKNSKKS